MKSVKNIPVRSAIVCCSVFLFSILYSGNGFANVYVPTTFTDPAFTGINNATGAITAGAGIGLISLRSALTAADNLGGTHTVTLSTGTYNLTQAIPNRQITIGNTNQNITINGNGPTNTIINMTNDANRDRILFINPTGATNSPVITVSGIRFQNAFLSSDPFGGAAICAGGGSGESLTVTNCTFDNNVIPANGYGGAAICMQVRGNLTVDNSTFTNNVSNDADGGAILFIIFNSGLGTGFGTLSVTNSTFTGNSVVFPGAPTSNGGALAFTGQAGVTPFNATINNNTFFNNTADGLGGGVSANNSPTVSIPQIHFNRFFNNTSTASALSSGLHFAESSGSVNAENNWWGCNTNPVNVSSTSPCNQAGGDVAGGGALDANPWLQLRTTASPSTICNTAASIPTNTSTITTSFLNNSDGTAVTLANISRLIGQSVTWPVSTLGSLSGQQVLIQASGTATALFTSNGTGGTATVNAQVDNVPAGEVSPARASITVNTASVAPTGATGTTTICNGGSTTITVSGGSKGTAASTQWFTGSCGGALVFTGDAFLTSPASTTTYFVRYTGTCNTTTCATVTVTVNNPSVAPSSISGTILYCNPGSTTITAIGGTLGTGANYQWGTGAVVGTSPLAGQTASTLNVSPVTTTTYWVRIENTTTPCTANTGGVTQVVTVNQPSVAPTSITGTTTICSPASTTLTAAGGTLGTGANYQWGTGSVVGATPIGGATNSTLLVTPGSTTTYWVRIENTTAPCTGTTGGVTQVVTVNIPSVAPTGATGTTTICIGGSTILTVTGGTKGTGYTTQWFTGSCGGALVFTGDAFTTSPGATTTYFVRYNGTCNTTTCATVTVTVSPNNTVTFSSGQVNQIKTVGMAITTTNWNTTGATGATFASLPPGVTGNWAANVATINGTVTTVGTYNYTITLTGGCNGGSTGGQIIVIPTFPVTLTSFTGKLNSDKTVTLQWKVEAQQDIQQYIVEESSDGIIYRQLGLVPASNSTVNTYSYIDGQVATGYNYYRLKIVELSGKITYSNIVLVNLKAGITVMLYPNPVTGQLTIQQFGTIQNKTAVLSDGQGKILQQIKLTSLQQQVNMETYSSGVYIVKMEDGTVFKVIKQ
jgi:hypothetical protein